MTIDEVKAKVANGDGLFKFVRVNGEYRFLNFMAFPPPNHCDAVEEGETAESAGAISVWPKFWKLSDSYSYTLKVHTLSEDYENITKLLGVPFLSDLQ
jgi:hypothetical protein